LKPERLDHDSRVAATAKDHAAPRPAPGHFELGVCQLYRLNTDHTAGPVSSSRGLQDRNALA
jgi:hypothetical protein